MTNGAAPVAPSIDPQYWLDSNPVISTLAVGRSLRRIARSIFQKFQASSRTIAKLPSAQKPRALTAWNFMPPTAICPMNSCRTEATSVPTPTAVQSRIGPDSCWKLWGAMVSVWGGNRVAVRIGPGGTWNHMSDSNSDALFDYVAAQINRFGLAYLHIIEPRVKGNVLIVEGQEPVATERLRKIFKGRIIAAGGFEPDTAEAVVEKGDADLVAFGRHFLANPDLPKRIKLGLPLNDYDRKTFYTFDFHGYTDYPFYEQQRDGSLSDPFCPQLGDSRFYFDSRLHAGAACVSANVSLRSESKNRALVLDAFDTLFNKRDYAAAERYLVAKLHSA